MITFKFIREDSPYLSIVGKHLLKIKRSLSEDKSETLLISTRFGSLDQFDFKCEKGNELFRASVFHDHSPELHLEPSVKNKENSTQSQILCGPIANSNWTQD